MMVEVRRHFHEQLAELESVIQRMATASGRLFERSLATLESRDVAECDAVIASDDQIDAFYLEIERGIVELFALQGPVASDLRFLATLLHINLHLERIADMGVNVAKIEKAVHDLPANPAVLARLKVMGTIALTMLSTAMEALARRDLDLARQLPVMDDPLDELNRGMLAEVLMSQMPEETLKWGIHMHVVSRQVERVGDHAVDIGEQVAYLVTGAFQEFTDASHPEVEEATRLTEGRRAVRSDGSDAHGDEALPFGEALSGARDAGEKDER